MQGQIHSDPSTVTKIFNPSNTSLPYLKDLVDYVNVFRQIRGDEAL